MVSLARRSPRAGPLLGQDAAFIACQKGTDIVLAPADRNWDGSCRSGTAEAGETNLGDAVHLPCRRRHEIARPITQDRAEEGGRVHVDVVPLHSPTRPLTFGSGGPVGSGSLPHSGIARLARSPHSAIAGRFARSTLAAVLMLSAGASVARATPFILIDAANGEVLDQQDATRSWFPASTTKLMTVFVALEAVNAGRLTFNTPLLVSPRAMSMVPSKMGFKPGTQVTLDNALKMLMVQSANDIAVTIAEGVSGSVEAFADEMNATAARLGMPESHWTNPNGLPDARHYSSARDLAVLARSLLQRFPEHADLYDIGAMRLGRRIYPTHNGLLGRYPGADGMKTGFTCAAGFNVVATATRGGKRLIAVVLGAPTATARTIKAATLFNRGFAGRTNAGGSLTSLASIGGEPPDMHDGVCRNRAKATAQYMAEIEDTAIPLTTDYTLAAGSQPERSFLTFGASVAQPVVAPAAIAALPRPVFTPINVFVGPVEGWTGPVAHADNYSGPPATTATAYAPQKAGDTPLPVSDDALPMKRGAAVAKVLRKPAVVARAHGAERTKVAHAANTKAAHAAEPKAAHVTAGTEGEPAEKPAAAKATPAKVKIAKVAPAKPAPHGKPAIKGKPKPAGEE